MATIFSKIINGDVFSYKLLEDDKHLAFLDIFPLAKGHVLVIPKKEEDYIFDIDSQDYIDLWKFAKKIAKSIHSAIECKRIGVAVVGLEIPHAHIHLVPLHTSEDINFSKPKLKFSEEEFISIANDIKRFI